MASRRNRDYDDDDGPSSGRKLNDYFIKGEGINREVLQSEICRFLGPEAYSRPAKFEGKEGFMIKAVRPFTPEMLKDLRVQSNQYEQDRMARKRGGHREGNSYEDFQRRRRDDSASEDYRVPSGSGYPPTSHYPQDQGMYQPAMQQGGYAMPAPGLYQPNQEYPGQQGGYQQPGYPAGYNSMAPNMPGMAAPSGYQDPRYQQQQQHQGYPYGGPGNPSREQPQYNYQQPGNPGMYDQRQREGPPGAYYPGNPGDRSGSAEAQQGGMMSPHNDMYGGAPAFAQPHQPQLPQARQQQPTYGAHQATGGRDYAPNRQGGDYNQGSRRR